MIIAIKVIPGAKKNDIKKEDTLFGEIHYKVYVTARPVENQANKAVVALLADHFGVKKSNVNIIKGLKSRTKKISIDGI